MYNFKKLSPDVMSFIDKCEKEIVSHVTGRDFEDIQQDSNLE